MHVEISVALNFVISYLYNKLPRRRVDLFAEELEAGLKKRFEGHWYPDTPSKGSGFRCIKGNGEEIDTVIIHAAIKCGLDLEEIKTYLPDDLTMWIDPSEVSYKIGERGQVKILYSDKQEKETSENADREVQAASQTFNPEAQVFTPESCKMNGFNTDAPNFTPDMLAFTPDVQAFCSESTQSFQPIDSLSSSMSSLSLSPSSPVPPSTWSTATSPTSALFTSIMSSPTPAPTVNNGYFNNRPQMRPQFTAASFAATKFGSTKLKSQTKRPNRLSPTELNNYFRQQQRSYTGPPRPRSLSPRDPRLEFMLDQQQRLYQQQQQLPQVNMGLQLPPNAPAIQHQQSGLPSPCMYSEFSRQNSSKSSSPLVSPQAPSQAFQELIHPGIQPPPARPTSFNNSFPQKSHFLNSFSPQGKSSQQALSPFTTEVSKPFSDSIGLGPNSYNNKLQHLLMAN